MQILGYGEDALTYWALSRHLLDVIGPLSDDSTEKDNLLLIYRPSFGRSGGNESAQFGEFDAIIGTPKAVYLVESKWAGEPIKNGNVVLAGRQILRHEIFRWIRDRWSDQRPANWDEFYRANERDFRAHFDEKPLPKAGRLVGNLEYLLRELLGRGAPTIDVLLYFHLDGGKVPAGVAEAPDFRVVPFLFRPVNSDCDGRIIEMQA
ncbi:MAG: hypothetical protein WCB27_12310 [Thermoguttaceae bacterium]|jgi:hypothetical protein